MKERIDNCATHGEFTARNIFSGVWTQCPPCQTKREAEQAEAAAAEEAAERADMMAKRINNCGINERFKTKGLSGFVAETEQQRKNLDRAIAYARNFENEQKSGRCLIFLGTPGTGKTHIASGIAIELLSKNYTVRYTTAMRLFSRIKDSWAGDAKETESQAIAALCGSALLIVDEVGVQHGSEFEKNMLFDILNERYERRKPTIMVSNLNKDELLQFVGERIFDRMREDNGEVLSFSGNSFRGRVGGELK